MIREEAAKDEPSKNKPGRDKESESRRTSKEDATNGPSIGQKSLARLWEILAPRKWQVVGLSLLIALSAALAQLSPQFVRIVIDQLIPRGEARLFLLMGAGLAVFYVVSEAVSYASMYLSFAFTQSVIADIRMRAYSTLLKLPLTRFTAERSGSLVSRVVSDVNALESMIQAGASRIVGQLFSIVVVLVILFVMNPLLAALSLVVVALMAFFTVYYQGPLRTLARGVRARVGEMTATATEAVGSIGVVKGFANEAFELGRFEKENDAYVKLNLDRRKQVGLMQGFVGLSAEGGVGALLLIGGWLIVRSRAGGDLPGALQLTTGELTAFLLYLNNLITPVVFVMNFNNVLQAGMAALERVNNLLEDEPESEGEEEKIGRGGLEFRGVRFRYPESETLSLDNLSFEVAPGSTVALVGPSGAGKSTVTKLLSRLYDPVDGEILLGGRDLRDYRLEPLRRAVAVVPQDPTLFSGSVRDNIRYAKPGASEAEVLEAARLANAHNFISELPRGYDTEIGERGVKLSGGQKQRVAIARAVLKEASVLILDEATSSLDAESEAVIQDALEGLFRTRRGVTTLIIAHRLSTVVGADEILVLARGKLLERGSHGELLAQGGLYRTLYDLQVGDGEHQRDVAVY